MGKNTDARFRRAMLPVTVLMIALSFLTIAVNLFLASLLPPLVRNAMDVSPMETRSSTIKEVTGEDDMLHIVTTRFMQDQANLVVLGKARLLLFETFCMPTMIHQNTDNFLWFVMTDPNLNGDLLQRLVSLLSPYPHFYLVASNSKLLTPANLTMGSGPAKRMILTGDINLLYSRMLDRHRPLLIETRLDADDGLHQKSLSEIQRLARELPVDTRGWQIICSEIHFEWRNDEIVNVGRTVESSGKLRLVREHICVTPGYTLVKHRDPPSIDFPTWPRLGHHLVTREWDECIYRGNGNATSDCWIKLGSFPAALRSRTITSAGMSRVTESIDSMFENQTTLFWELVQKSFSVNPSAAMETSKYLKDNMKSIILDNLKGQCTFGHSCKESSKVKLYSLLNETTIQVIP